MRHNTQLEDVPELMQHIQSWLPVEEAARTSVLSKAWLHAWSTIPTLRFHVSQTNHLEVVDHTLNRYIRDNIPVECFELNIRLENQESASFVEKWIRSLATKTCFKELSLSIITLDVSLTLPDETLSFAKNLTKLRVSSQDAFWMTSNHHPPIINWPSLRELHLLEGVCISQEVIDGILSSCILLEKIKLFVTYMRGLNTTKILNTIKIKNLPHLNELSIAVQRGGSIDLEISDLPNLCLFSCYLYYGPYGRLDVRPFTTYSISLGSSVTELRLGGMITNNASLDMIKSGFPFLENLTIDLSCWTLECFHFTCASLKKLSLKWSPPDRLNEIKVYAPKLHFFCYGGYTMPTLLFPISSIKQMLLMPTLFLPVSTCFFLKMREALMLSCKCDVHITTFNYEPQMDIDVHDLRTRLMFPPANNVQRLEFQTVHDECMWEHSPFFDAFFEICHPKHVFAQPDEVLKQTNHFCKLMVTEVLERKTTTRGESWLRYLKNVQIRRYEKWETLTNLHRSFLDGSAINFKLKWH